MCCILGFRIKTGAMSKKKRIIFVRHAKSSWDDFRLSDKQRPLNKRGMRDAPRMATYLKGILGNVDIIIASSAVRTRATALFMANELLSNPEAIVFSDELYACEVEDYLEKIHQLPEDCRSVLFVGHNPTITEIAYCMQGQLIQHVPTCGVIIADCTLNKWEEFDFDSAKVESIVNPKMI